MLARKQNSGERRGGKEREEEESVFFRRLDSWGTIPSGSPRNPSESDEPHGGNAPPVIRFFVFRLDLIAFATTSTRFKVSHV